VSKWPRTVAVDILTRFDVSESLKSSLKSAYIFQFALKIFVEMVCSFERKQNTFRRNNYKWVKISMDSILRTP
jgi:hypothetical protein